MSTVTFWIRTLLIKLPSIFLFNFFRKLSKDWPLLSGCIIRFYPNALKLRPLQFVQDNKLFRRVARLNVKIYSLYLPMDKFITSIFVLLVSLLHGRDLKLLTRLYRKNSIKLIYFRVLKRGR